VCLYVGMTDSVDACLSIRNILKDNSIPYQVSMNLPKDQDNTFKMLSDSVFGSDFVQYEVKSFPFVTWTEYYDDYERYMEITFTLEQIQQSNVIKFKSLVSE